MNKQFWTHFLYFHNRLGKVEVLTGRPVLVAEGDDLEEPVHNKITYETGWKEIYLS